MGLITPERWQILSARLDEYFELEPAQRPNWFAALKQDDSVLAEELSVFLSVQDSAGFSRFLGSPAFTVDEELTALIGRQVGAYVIDSELGRGGMGSVWRAHRADGLFEGVVAIKFVNAVWLGRDGEQRFRREGSLLGQLNHPNIARLIDAGFLNGKEPYLVLEYVEGEAIDVYCDRLGLDVNARVHLFLDVLAAVAHAHQHLIVHRDIKPANIFVTRDGVVKLLDFGVAKLIDDSDSPALTKSGLTALTPQYAAPEQLLGQPITTATDVYALGLVLFTLLTGSHPLSAQSLSGAALVQAVLTTDAPRASALPGLASDASRTLKGDLDNILAKALKKNTTDRYSTSGAFADDLRRYLHHEPVSAHRDSFNYVLGKLVRRHRWQVITASATLAVLVAGVIATTLQAREARRQRAEAVAQRDRARTLLSRNDAIFDFVEMMLSEAVPADQMPAIQQMLDRGSKFVDIAAGGQLDRQAEILRVLSTYYIELSLPQKAAPLLEKAMQVLQAGNDLSLQAEMACAYSQVLNIMGREQEAATLQERWGSNQQIDGTVAANCLQDRAIVAQGRNDAKLALQFAQLGLQRARSAAIPSEILEATLTGDEGFALHLQGRNAEAVERFDAALKQFEKIGRQDSQSAKTVMMNWSVVALGSGDFGRGLEITEKLLRAEQKIAGAEPVWPVIIANYAKALEVVGRYPEALIAYDQTYDSAVKNGFVSAQGYALIGKANILVQTSALDRAQKELDHAGEVLRGKVSDTSATQIRRMLVQSEIDSARGKLKVAEDGISHVVDLLNAQGDKTNSALVSAYRQRAAIELQLDQPAMARQDADKAVELARNLGEGNAYSAFTGQANLILGNVLHVQGDNAAARAALTTAVQHLSKTEGPDHPDTRQAQKSLTEL
jgi:serine/threonine protein kinase/tetratricopeptide (TPR) repeat protein